MRIFLIIWVLSFISISAAQGYMGFHMEPFVNNGLGVSELEVQDDTDDGKNFFPPRKILCGHNSVYADRT